MSTYGSIYKTTDFVKRLLPKKAINAYMHTILDFLQYLDQSQEKNPLVTLSVHVGDGIWVYYQGERQFFIKPTQRYLKFHIFSSNEISSAIEKQKTLFTNESQVEYAYKVWNITSPEVKWIISFIDEYFKMPKFDKTKENEPHPRHIPGAVRQAVLEEFERTGRICNGVAGLSKKHKVEQNSPIEFDHILPHSRGGSNSYDNVQILCKKCNRIKSAKAA